MEPRAPGRRLPGAGAVLLVHALAGGQAVAVRHRRSGLEEHPACRSYILHEPYPSREGIGSSLKHFKPVIEVALRQNLKYVCQEKDFRSSGHATGNLGYLFGCIDNSHVVGDMVAYDRVKALSWVHAKIGTADDALDAPRAEQANRTPILLHVEVEPCKVYYVDQPGLISLPWGASYKWFRSQFHMVRKMNRTRRTRQCGSTDRTSIVVLVRRGDSALKSPTKTFGQILDKLFAGNIPDIKVNETQSHITVISEAEDDGEFGVFKQYTNSKVSYWLGAPEKEEGQARERLVRDLDCASMADILLLSRGGFSSLAAALQKEDGISLSFDEDDLGRPDVPNVRRVEVKKA